MSENQSGTANRLDQLPQNVRVGNARSVVRQALAVSTATYGLTIQEAAMVAEGVLNDARADLLAFTEAQYERLAMPEQAREPAPAGDARKPRTVDGNAVIRPAPVKEGEAKAS